MPRCRTIATVSACVFLLYVGGYLALSDPMLTGISIANGQMQMEPNYLFGGTMAKRVFSPMELIDQRIRPDFWAKKPFRSTVLVYESDP